MLSREISEREKKWMVYCWKVVKISDINCTDMGKSLKAECILF